MKGNPDFGGQPIGNDVQQTLADDRAASERPQDALEGRRRWEDVLFPSYRSEPASGRSQRLQRPRWLDRGEDAVTKDLTGQVRDDLP